MSAERRKEPRVDANLHARLAGREEPVHVMDVSGTGCSLAGVPADVAFGQKVQLVFRLPGSDTMSVTGSVRWRYRDCAGVEFFDTTFSQQVALRSFVIRSSVCSLIRAS